MQFESFILAGGKSSRMKSDKAFLKLAEKTLLEHSISTLRMVESKNISVVLGEDSDKFVEIDVKTDIYKKRGTLGGIHSALTNCNEEYALIIACDYPFISAALLNYLLEIANNSITECVVPIQKDGIIQPLCGIFETKKCLEVLTAILDKSNKTPSARSFLEQIDTKFVKFKDFEHLPHSEHFFFNINTPKDYIDAIEIHTAIK